MAKTSAHPTFAWDDPLKLDGPPARGEPTDPEEAR